MEVKKDEEISPGTQKIEEVSTIKKHILKIA